MKNAYLIFTFTACLLFTAYANPNAFIEDEGASYQKCDCAICAEPEGDLSLKARRYLDVDTQRLRDLRFTFPGEKMYPFGEGDDKELYSIPWVSKDIEDRPDPSLFVEVDFAMGKLTKTTMIQEGDGDYTSESSKSFEIFIAKVPFPTCQGKNDSQSVASISIGGRAGHVQDEVWYAVQMKGKPLTHLNLAGGVVTGNTFRRGDNPSTTLECGGVNDTVAGEICPIATAPGRVTNKKDVRYNVDYFVLNRNDVILTPDENRARIHKGRGELFNEVGTSGGHFYVIAYLNDVNGAYSDFMWDIQTYDENGNALTEREPIPYSMLNTDEKLLGESKFPNGKKDARCYFKTDECDGDCDNKNLAFIHGLTSGGADNCDDTKLSATLTYTELFQRDIVQPGVYGVENCASIPGERICDPTQAPTTSSPTVPPPTEPPAPHNKCMRHAVPRNVGNLEMKVGEAMGGLHKVIYDARPKHGKECMCVPGFEARPLTGGWWDFECKRQEKRGPGDVIFDSFKFENKCAYAALGEPMLDFSNLPPEISDENRFFKLKVTAKYFDVGESIIAGQLLYDVTVDEVKSATSNTKIGTIDGTYKIRASSSATTYQNVYVEQFVRDHPRYSAVAMTEDEYKVGSQKGSNFRLFCYYQTQLLPEQYKPEQTSYLRCPENHYAKGSQITYEEFLYLNCPEDSQACGATNLANAPSETRDEDGCWCQKKTSKVCSKTHSVLPTNNYNGFQNFGQRSKKGKKESFKYCAGSTSTWKHNFFASESTCEAAGLRLCSAWELYDGFAGARDFGSGCNYNSYLVWSETPCVTGNDCGDNGENCRIVRAGGEWVSLSPDQRNKKKHKCMNIHAKSSTAFTRCCIDKKERIYPICTKCPEYSTSPKGSFGEESCTCTYGYKDNGYLECNPPNTRRDL